MTLVSGNVLAGAALAAALLAAGWAAADPMRWAVEWPDTDFSKSSVDFREIFSGGPPKDGIPSIDRPKFVAAADEKEVADSEPVIGLVVGGEARAYPLRILTWHEIVNDEIGGVPVAVTYCPLCNSAIAFDRRIDGRVLEFGTTGKLRHSDMVMYDRQTETWWQQFMGEAIVGAMTGKRLKPIPARLESFANFKSRAPDGKVLVPSDRRMRAYGRNPYAGYDSTPYPFLFAGELPKGIEPMVRVVVVDGEAWSMPLLREKRTITKGDLVLTWRSGQNSALDTQRIQDGRDVGNVVVQRVHDGKATDVVYDVTFAFVYNVFYPGRAIHVN
jgi:hypothetical protein